MTAADWTTTPVAWLWIPVTLWAAFAQTVRNAAQRHLTTALGTLGATLVRFLYGVPFALAWLGIVHAWTGAGLPALNLRWFLWVFFGAATQILATAFLLLTMQQRNFALGVAYARSDAVQVALFGLLFLGDALSPVAITAVGLGTIAMLMLSPADPQHPWRALVTGWTSPTALLGLASGAGFAISAVAYRGAALALPDTPFLVSAANSLVAAQLIQTVLLGGWLLARDAPVVVRVVKAWRESVLAGFMGAAASAGWFTAFAIEPAAHVRTLGLVELVLSLAVSRKFFREPVARREVIAIAFLMVGVAAITLLR
jgi:drug/metabolite transporter (DMT)-like permease